MGKQALGRLHTLCRRDGAMAVVGDQSPTPVTQKGLVEAHSDSSSGSGENDGSFTPSMAMGAAASGGGGLSGRGRASRAG